MDQVPAVHHPFTIPASIDGAVTNDDAAFSIWRIGQLIQSMVIVDRGFPYWASTLTCVGMVIVLQATCMVLVYLNIRKGAMRLFNWSEPLRSNGTFKCIVPTYAAAVCLGLTVASFAYISICIHRFRLDQQIESGELHETALWFGSIWLPIWLVLYSHSLHFFLAVAIGKKEEQPNSGSRILRRAIEVVFFAIARFVFPVAVTLSIIIPSHIAQRKFNGVIDEMGLFLSNITTVMEYWTELGATTNAMNALRRVEERAINIWTDTAHSYDRLQSIYLLWSIYFGILILPYGIGAAVSMLTPKHSSSPDTEVAPTSPVASMMLPKEVDQQDDGFKTAQNLYGVRRSKANASTLEKVIKVITLTCCAVLATVMCAFCIFCAVRIPHHGAFGTMPKLLGMMLLLLDVISISAGALCVAILTISLRNAYHLEHVTNVNAATNQVPPPSMNRGPRSPARTRSMDSDVTLA